MNTRSAPEPIVGARLLLERFATVASLSAQAALHVEAEAVIASLEESMVALDYRARQLLQQTGDLRAAAKERSLLGLFLKSPDEKSNLVAQEECRATRAVCKALIDQLRSTVDGSE